MRVKMNEKERIGLGIQNPGRSCVRAEQGLTRIPKICIHDYECRHCAFDQWLEEMEVRAIAVLDDKIEKGLLADAA